MPHDQMMQLGIWHQVSRKVRRLWEVQRLGSCPAPDHDYDGLFSVQQHRRSKRHCCPFGGHDRANSSRQREDGAGAGAVFSRRCSGINIQQQEFQPPGQIQSIQPPRRATLGHNYPIAYLRELDTITTKRLELTGGSASSSSGGAGQPPTPKVKPNPKKKWKPKPQDRDRDGEEEG